MEIMMSRRHSMMRVAPGMLAAHDFSVVPQANIPRSVFNRSHGHKTTFDAGYLIPILVDEALPGDTFSLRMTAFARIATLLFPIMDNLWLDTHFFFVPNRILWDHWEQFMGANIPNPTSSTDFICPTVTSPMGGFTEGSLYDYMGLPTGVANITVNALFLRAYNIVWNEWYRDENIQDSVPQDNGDGPDTTTDYVLLQRGKRKDYFTGSLPFPQKGPAVELPLGTSAPVFGTGTALGLTDGTSNLGLGTTDAAGTVLATGTGFYNVSTGAGTLGSTPANNIGIGVVSSGVSGLYADLSEATAATINQLRQAFQIQRLYERDARGGTRYTEIIQSHFNVTSPDSRLQRPEFLGGGTQPITITPVAQTSPPTGSSGVQTNVQANLAAFGTCAVHGHGFTYSFQEHGIILGLVSVRSDYTYWQGANRMWFRSTRFDYYWPVFSHLGEQSIFNQEIYAQGNSTDTEVFGYQEAWAEYRYKPSLITSLFRPNATGTLDSWHLSQDFGSLPTLSPTFIVENPPMSRIEAISEGYDFIMDTFLDYKCARPMPTYAVPGWIDHF